MENRRARLECCVDSLESGENAVLQGGARRLEICTALSEGGLTPSLGLFLAIKRAVQIEGRDEVFLAVLIRPRAGDFVYSPAELAVMAADIDIFKNNGAHGVVLGALDRHGLLDLQAMNTLLNEVGPDLEVTFHRAIDVSRDPLEAVKTCCGIKRISRVLTSGGALTAMEGAEVIHEMVKVVESSDRRNDFIIAVGSGVSESNGTGLLLRTGAHQLHGSLRQVRVDRINFASPVMDQMGGSFKAIKGGESSSDQRAVIERSISVTSGNKVRALLLSLADVNNEGLAT